MFPVHPPAVAGDSAYSMEGPRAGRLLDERYARSWPAEGICTCGQVIRRESKDAPWQHTGRMPGEGR